MEPRFSAAACLGGTGCDETEIASAATVLPRPRLSADGSRLAWSDLAEGRPVAYLSDLSEPGAASPHQVCQDCVVHDYFSPPTEALIAYGSQLVRQNPATRAQIPLLDIEGLVLTEAALSPGDRWVAFVVALPDGMAALYVAPTSKKPVPRDSWMQIAKDRNYLGSPNWSADGKLVYYESSRDDHYCVWTQRITAGGQSDGAPVGALHMRQSMQSGLYGGAPFGITSDKLYLLLPDVRGNAWMVNVDR